MVNTGGSSPDDLSELLDDIASVSDLEGGLSDDSGVQNVAINVSQGQSQAMVMAVGNFQGLANHPPRNSQMPCQAQSEQAQVNSTQQFMSGQDAPHFQANSTPPPFMSSRHTNETSQSQANANTHFMSAQDTTQLLTNILTTMSTPGNNNPIKFEPFVQPGMYPGLNNNVGPAQHPQLLPISSMSQNNSFHQNFSQLPAMNSFKNIIPNNFMNTNMNMNMGIEPLPVRFNPSVAAAPTALNNNSNANTITNNNDDEQNTAPNSPPSQSPPENKESLQKISIINNLVDWEKLKPALMETKKTRKPAPKVEPPKPPELHSEPVKIRLPQLKKLLRALKRSRKTTKQIQEWDKKMGLKKCHSRTMTKTCTSRKRLIEIMQEISMQARKKEADANFAGTKAA